MEKSIEFPSNRIDVIIGEKMRLNIMVVGESGQGKTTYLHTLLRRYVDSVYLVDPLSLLKKTIQIIEVGKFSITDVSERANLDIYLYDSPGYGDFINNQSHIDAIYENIITRHNHRNSLDFPLLSDKERNESDTRIHCVFYFIASHRMKDIDMEFIEKLCPIVPLVPIIAKADMMTVHERNQHVKAVYDRLQDLSTKLHRSCVFEFVAVDFVGMTEENVQVVASDGDNQNMTIQTVANNSTTNYIIRVSDDIKEEPTESFNDKMSVEGKEQFQQQFDNIDIKDPSRIVNVIENVDPSVISESSSSSSLSKNDNAFHNSNNNNNHHDHDQSIPIAAEKENLDSPTTAIMTQSWLADSSSPSPSSSSGGIDNVDNDILPTTTTTTHHPLHHSPPYPTSTILKEAYYYENRQQQITYQPLIIAHNVNSAIEHYPNIFAVVCDLSNERVYPWGKLEIYDMNHSDFRRLQMLLFEEGQNIKRLIDMTNEMSKTLYIKASRKSSSSTSSSSSSSSVMNIANIRNDMNVNNNIDNYSNSDNYDSITMPLTNSQQNSITTNTTTTSSSTTALLSDRSSNNNDEHQMAKEVNSATTSTTSTTSTSNNTTTTMSNKENDKNKLSNTLLIYLLNILLSCVIVYYIINIYLLNFT